MVTLNLSLRESLLKFSSKKTIEAFVEIQSKSANEGGVIPGAGIGIVAKIGEVEDFGASFHCVKNFAGEIRIAVLEDLEDEIQGFESNDPIAGFSYAFGDGVSAGGGVGFVGSN